MVGINYDRSCIKSDSCTEEQRMAATYDYVGSVYGEEGKVSYDGVLTDAEREYVIGKFGDRRRQRCR